ncbi:MAG: hypothetical protein UZ22_OP11002000707 [Microgenomates bacterium OLB23]|nr:MAG: hypothetical protein UZ22_OP11002000707 [Microgenomates bacterium OLB23]
MLNRLYKKDEVPPIADILNENNTLWNSYIDPLSGALQEYKHLMLASNLLTYRVYRTSTGDYFFADNKFSDAEHHYREALRYDKADVNVFHRLAAALSEQKKCTEAELILTEAYTAFPEDLATRLFFYKALYRL